MNRELRQRVVSALLLAPAVLLLVYAGGPAFAALVVLAAVLLVLEWTRLTGNESERELIIVAVSTAVVAVGLSQFGALAEALFALLAGVVASALLARRRGRPALWPALGLAWLGLPCIALVWLRGHPDIGFELLVAVLVAVWACDSVAYFAGRTLGGPRLAPVWSPKKTWSGLVGGCLGSALTLVLWAHWSGLIEPATAIWAGVSLALISQAGDICESAVKRRFGVKDSGALIPGHGGLWDRVDGLLFAAPAAAVLVLLWEKGAP